MFGITIIATGFIVLLFGMIGIVKTPFKFLGIIIWALGFLLFIDGIGEISRPNSSWFTPDPKPGELWVYDHNISDDPFKYGQTKNDTLQVIEVKGDHIQHVNISNGQIKSETLYWFYVGTHKIEP